MVTDKLYLAGGCFWGMEELFRKQKGVTRTEVGYAGGAIDSPTYKNVSTGATGHAESLEIEFNPAQTSLKDLLLYFFKIHNPTTPNRQGNDVGTQYRSVIFYQSPEQKRIAEEIISYVNATGVWGEPIVTQVQPLAKFWAAEDYHQDYLQKEPNGYTCHFERPIKF